MRLGLLLPASLVPLIVALACGSTGGTSPEAARARGSPAAATRTQPALVPELQDLIGVRGGAAETQMQARGYTAVGGHDEEGASITYWRQARDGSCVSVRTADGRYQVVAPATAQDCERAETATRIVAKPDPGGYRTVCGVMVQGRPIRYVCSVVGGDQHRTPTTLRFPDMVMVLHWQGVRRVRVELEGMVPIEGTWTESEGETTVATPEKTWFYASDRDAAAREVRSLEEDPCSDAWARSIEAKVPTGDGQGHGPDLGSEEWRSVVEFKLGIRGRANVPSRDSPDWCRTIDRIVRERGTP